MEGAIEKSRRKTGGAAWSGHVEAQRLIFPVTAKQHAPARHTAALAHRCTTGNVSQFARRVLTSTASKRGGLLLTNVLDRPRSPPRQLCTFHVHTRTLARATSVRAASWLRPIAFAQEDNQSTGTARRNNHPDPIARARRPAQRDPHNAHTCDPHSARSSVSPIKCARDLRSQSLPPGSPPSEYPPSSFSPPGSSHQSMASVPAIADVTARSPSPPLEPPHWAHSQRVGWKQRVQRRRAASTSSALSPCCRSMPARPGLSTGASRW